MEIKVLGPGCAKCDKLLELAQRTVADSGVDATVIKVDRLDQIAAAGIVIPPGLVIDGQLKCAGQVPRAARIAGGIKEAAGQE